MIDKATYEKNAQQDMELFIEAVKVQLTDILSRLDEVLTHSFDERDDSLIRIAEHLNGIAAGFDYRANALHDLQKYIMAYLSKEEDVPTVEELRDHLGIR